MARVMIESDDGRTRIEVREDDDGLTYGDCKICGDAISDRGQFEDTCEAISLHIDQRHGGQL